MRIDVGIQLAKEAGIPREAGNLTSPRGDFSAELAAAVPERTKAGGTGHTPVPASGYDFRSISPEALHRAVGDLTKSGQMDLDDSTSLLGIMAPSTALSHVSSASSDVVYAGAPLDVFSLIQSRIDGAASRGEMSSVAGLHRAADALSRLQGLASNSAGAAPL